MNAEIYRNMAPIVPLTAPDLRAPACPLSEYYWLHYLLDAVKESRPLRVSVVRLTMPDKPHECVSEVIGVQKSPLFGKETILVLSSYPGMIADEDGVLIRPIRKRLNYVDNWSKQMLLLMKMPTRGGKWYPDVVGNLMSACGLAIDKNNFTDSVLAANKRMQELEKSRGS